MCVLRNLRPRAANVERRAAREAIFRGGRRGTGLADRHGVKRLAKLTLVLAALGAAAGCGRAPLDVGEGETAEKGDGAGTDGLAVPGPCAGETTLAGCESRTDCHAVFADQGMCDCPAMAQLDHCADGAKAICEGTVSCHRTPPHCESPDFVVSYAPGCFEGCVRAKDCAP
jgi:hypothetical protein